MIDMHIHSVFSDGEYTPEKILEICNSMNITTIAITDHNEILGVKKAIEQNRFNHIRVIPGIELSATAPSGIQRHILGYNIDLNNKELIEITKAIREEGVKKIKSILEVLNQVYKISFPEEEIDKLFETTGNIGRLHIAKLFVKHGYTENTQSAFDKFLEPIDDKVYKKKVKLSAKECIEYIINAGGVACHAHPITLKMDMCQLSIYFSELMNSGLQAVEVFHSEQNEKFTKDLNELTKKLSLCQSVGSDFHGPICKPKIKLGTGINNNLGYNYASILDIL